MKVSEVINQLKKLMDQVGDINVYIGGSVDVDGEDRNITYEIDYIGNVFDDYIYFELGDDFPEPGTW